MGLIVSYKKILKVFRILSLLELYVAITTRVQIQSAQKPYATFPLPDDALHEVNKKQLTLEIHIYEIVGRRG